MNKRPNATHGRSSTPQQVRIIAGQWRGRMLPVIQQDEVRPTPNRVRETLFNWLQGRIEGSRCLDLYAGSGALGFESASRGAGQVTLVDNDPQVIAVLQKNIEMLRGDQLEVVCADGLAYLAMDHRQFDLVFLDPPYSKVSVSKLLDALTIENVLKDKALIYVEGLPGTLPVNLPKQWQWWRQSRASQVEYGLISTP